MGDSRFPVKTVWLAVPHGRQVSQPKFTSVPLAPSMKLFGHGEVAAPAPGVVDRQGTGLLARTEGVFAALIQLWAIVTLLPESASIASVWSGEAALVGSWMYESTTLTLGPAQKRHAAAVGVHPEETRVPGPMPTWL